MLSQIKRLKSFADLPMEPIYAISMLVDQEKSKPIIDDFNQGFTGQLTAVTSGFGAIDFLKTGVHKA